MRKALALALFAICAAPMFASVQLDTSISDVFNRGSNELAGSITWTVVGEDFREASTEEPVYIRIKPDHNAFLAETLVHQTSTNATLAAPIYLAMKLTGSGSGGGLNIAALPEAVSIVRWVEGESALWIRVQQTSDQWLAAPGALTGPTESARVSWTIGVTARLSDSRNDQSTTSNLPFNTREATATENTPEDSTSTLLCVDLRASNLFADGTDESLLKYDIIALDENAEIGTGVYSRDAGNDTGINFTNDFSIARGKDRACEVTVLTAGKGVGSFGGALCIDRADSNGTAFELVKLGNSLSIWVDCEFGGNFLNSDLVAGSYVSFSTDGNGDYGFREGDSVSFDGEAGHAALSGSFTNNGYTLWQNADLVYDGASVSLNNGYRLDMNICVYTHYTDDPTSADVDWDVTLLSHAGSYDDFPYDGSDQLRKCEPSAFTLAGGVFNVGEFVECSGNPVSIFFPYVPKLVGNSDFWVGLSNVNQGAADLSVEAIAYDESGNRFSASLGDLDIRNQKTWLMVQNAAGIVEISGQGENNAGEIVTMTSADPDVPSSQYGVTRSCLFVRGTYPAEFNDEVDNGDLDGYLLVGNATTSSVDGAYLARNYDNRQVNQDADLPIWRSKAAPSVSKIKTNVESTFRVK